MYNFNCLFLSLLDKTIVAWTMTWILYPSRRSDSYNKGRKSHHWIYIRTYILSHTSTVWTPQQWRDSRSRVTSPTSLHNSKCTILEYIGKYCLYHMVINSKDAFQIIFELCVIVIGCCRSMDDQWCDQSLTSEVYIPTSLMTSFNIPKGGGYVNGSAGTCFIAFMNGDRWCK
jgi:hypothetical protein